MQRLNTVGKSAVAANQGIIILVSGVRVPPPLPTFPPLWSGSVLGRAGRGAARRKLSRLPLPRVARSACLRRRHPPRSPCRPLVVGPDLEAHSAAAHEAALRCPRTQAPSVPTGDSGSAAGRS